MTLEFSLRRRAFQARCFGVFYLCVAVCVLITTYISFPSIAKNVLNTFEKKDVVVTSADVSLKTIDSEDKAGLSGIQIYTLIVLALALTVIISIGYLMGRVAMTEMESALRLNALADALCLTGYDIDRFGKMASIFAPIPKNKSSAELALPKDVKTMAEVLKPTVPIPK